jgi:hypothetical protein
MEPNTEVTEGDHTALTGAPSLDTWSGTSSLSELGGAPDPPPLQYPTNGQDPNGSKD